MYEIVDEYKLLETHTGNIIHIDTNKKHVKKLQRTLLTGSGFNGNTPMFFSNSYSDTGHKEKAPN
jgi:hypothetical protein